MQHEVTTKLYAVRLYRQVRYIQYVCRRYHISKASQMRWNKQYDGTMESLASKSHSPQTPHPNAHTEEELSWIRNLHRRNPNISVCEMYGKLREEKACNRHSESLYCVFVRLGYRRKAESTKKKSKYPGKYDTPAKLGVKWQIDVKYVPKVCCVGQDNEVFFQYTMIEEASRKRFIYAYKEQSSFSTVDFVKRAIAFFGYVPKIIQTDNGGEFCHTAKTKRVYPLELFCMENGIAHKTIRPRTPWHNGKVERSHRNDQERFYNHLSFYSLGDLQLQMKRYLRQSSNSPLSVLSWKSPALLHKELACRGIV